MPGALWVNRVSGTPQLRDFDTTFGLGPPLCIDVTTGILYYLSLTGSILSLGGRKLQPEIFGAVGDGVTGDFLAFKAMRIAVNIMGGAEIDLTYGKNYFMERYAGDGLGTAINDLMFDGLGFFKFNGNGATISVFGQFNRAVSGTSPLPGLKVRNSSNVTIRDLILNGNNQVMTRAGGVGEPSAEGLNLNGVYNTVLANIISHHHAADGFYFDGYFNGTSGKASRRLSAKNLYAYGNGRNALTITQLRDFKIESSTFNDSGIGIGTYTQHSPCSSLDIEPNATTASASPLTMDVNTGNGVFEACTFDGSNQNILTCAKPNAVDNVKFIKCKGTAPAGLSSAVNAIYFDLNGGTMEDCDWDCGDQAFGLTFTGLATTDVSVIGGSIKGRHDVIHCNHAAANARIEKVRIISTATVPFTIGGSKDWFLQLDCANLVYTDNYHFVPKEAFNREGAGDYHEIMQTGTFARADFNRFETDLPVNQSGATTAHFANAFIAGNTSPIFDDHYKGTAPGAADTWRPTKNDVFNDTGYYNRNH